MLHRSIFRLGLGLAALGLGGCGDPAQTTAVRQPEATPTRPVTAAITASPLTVATPTTTVEPDHLYMEATASGKHHLLVLNGLAGERRLPFGLPAPDWSALYTVEAANGATTVRAVDPATGRPLRETILDGSYSLPATTLDGTLSGLSPNGKWLALAAPREPAARDQDAGARSGFAVLDTAFKEPARTLLLDGNFSVDAISNSGHALYLIEHLPPERPDQYRVRLYNLHADELDERIIADKRQAPQLMEGTRYATVAAPDGDWLYSVYLNPHHGPFIHALHLNDAFAFCIFLPPLAKDDWTKQRFWSVAMRDDGTLYAVNAALGIVAEVNPAQVNIDRSVVLAGAPPADQASHRGHQTPPGSPNTEGAMGGAVLSPDGKTLWTAGPTGLLAINTADFSLRGRYLEDQAFTSIALSEDGERLYAVSPDSNTLLRVDATRGNALGALPLFSGSSRMLRVETRR